MLAVITSIIVICLGVLAVYYGGVAVVAGITAILVALGLKRRE